MDLPRAHINRAYRETESLNSFPFIDMDSPEHSQNGINNNRHSSVYSIPVTDRIAANYGSSEENGGNGALADDNIIVVLENAKNEKSVKADEFRSLLPFCVMFGLGSLFSQSLTIYLSSQITVIERAFDLSSIQSGILLSANDVGFVATVLCASHFLKNFHIPRILSICVFLFGVSGILTSLPHFIQGEVNQADLSPWNNYTIYKDEDLLLCLSQNSMYNKTESCASKSSHRSGEGGHTDQTWMMILVVFLMILQGMAKAPRSALSGLYIDNNSKREKTGFYLGILTSFNIFGPFVAVITGGLFNQIPVDLKETALSPEDPRWISAWWLGFVVFGAGAILISIPMFFYPASLRTSRTSEETTDQHKVVYANASELSKTANSCIKEIQDLPKSLGRVLSNPVYTFLMLATTTFVFAMLALGSFGPKYIENQFHIPTWKANIVLGVNKLLTTILGTLLGGIITRRYRMDLLSCVKMVLVTRIIGLICDSFNYLWGCDFPHVVGLDSLNSTSCDCTNAPYLPVCGEGITFFSPCHAQCTVENDNVYTNCTAVASGTVRSGICDTGCNDLILFVSFNCLASMISTMAIAPTFLTTLRCVQNKDRAMAMGLNSFLMALLVFIPAPILYGRIFDATCRHWQTSCSGTGSCAVYDIRGMRYSLVSVEVGLKVVSVFMVVMCLWFARRSKEMKENGSPSITRECKPPVPQPRVSLSKQGKESVF